MRIGKVIEIAGPQVRSCLTSLAGIFILVFLVATSAYPTTFAPQPFEQVLEDSPVIVRGKIMDRKVDYAQVSEGVRQLYTFYRIEIAESLKGPTPAKNELTFREMGGEKDGVGMQVSGTAEFATDENVVVFLGLPGADGVYSLRGLMTGKLNFSPSPGGTEGGKEDGILTGPAIEWAPQHDTAGESAAKQSQKQWTLSRMRQVLAEQAKSRELEQKKGGFPPTKSAESGKEVAGAISSPSTSSPDQEGAGPSNQALALQPTEVGALPSPTQESAEGNRVLTQGMRSWVYGVIFVGSLFVLLGLTLKKRRANNGGLQK
jgi:hypothetical protein